MNNQKKLLEIIDSLCNSNQSEFARRMGMPQPTIASWLKRGTLDYEKISSIFPELSAEWLLREEGDMLKSAITQNATGENVTQIAGNGNQVSHTYSIDRALDEITEQRKLVSKSQEQITKSQEQITKSQEQIDRLLGIIEQMTKIKE